MPAGQTSTASQHVFDCCLPCLTSVSHAVQDARADAQSSRFSRFFNLEQSPVPAQKAEQLPSMTQAQPQSPAPPPHLQQLPASSAVQALFQEHALAQARMGAAPGQAGAQHLLQQLQAGGMKVACAASLLGGAGCAAHARLRCLSPAQAGDGQARADSMQGQSALFEKLAQAAAAQNTAGLPGMPKGAARTLDDIEAALKGGGFELPQGGQLQLPGVNPGNTLLNMLQGSMRSSPQLAQVRHAPCLSGSPVTLYCAAGWQPRSEGARMVQAGSMSRSGDLGNTGQQGGMRMQPPGPQPALDPLLAAFSAQMGLNQQV